ncbi:MAG: hypothetical protein SWK76_09500 [Actinomycetota bacterium]|nr:hypothetical protein [Actinomycetota bacterium]
MATRKLRFSLRVTTTALAAVLLLLLTGSTVLMAGAEVKWVTDGIPMTRAAGDDDAPLVVADGSGGAVIVWKSVSMTVGAQRVDVNGNLLWGNDGIVVFTGISGTVFGYDVIPDGSGGAFVVCDEAGGKIHGQHIDQSGNLPWGAAGVLLHCGSADSWYPRMCSDGSGGFIAAWEDQLNPSGNNDILAQRVDSTGTTQWNAVVGGGAYVYSGSGDQTHVQVVAGSSSDAIVAWQDDRSGDDYVYSQRMDTAGNRLWNANGVNLGKGGWGEHYTRDIATDGVGGAIVGWEYPGGSATSSDIYAQRICSAGLTQWTAGGVPVCANPAAQWRPQVVSNGAQGAYIAWDDYRGNETDVYCQNITSAGSPYWMADGFRVTVQVEAQREVRAAPDGAGGVILSWMDSRHGYDYEVYAQRLNDAGNEYWTSTGARICSKESGEANPALANTASGEAIIAWRDTRNTSTTGYDIYAQRVITTGGPLPTTWYFAEGTTRSDFNQFISIENANAAESEVKITYMLEGGVTQKELLAVPGRSRATVNVNAFLLPGTDNSAQVETTNNVQVVVERPMYFNYNGVWTGGHDVVGVSQARQEWYFAEGTTRPGFEQYICIQNPEATDALVHVDYMLENSQVIPQDLTVVARSRQTIPVNGILGPDKDNSAKVSSTNGVPIVVERPMYFNYNGVWTGGHCTTGALEPAENWYFAEGTTRPEFDQYICLQNPETNKAEVTITYMLEGGVTEVRTLGVEPESRTTVNVKQVLGLDKDNSAEVKSTNGVKIVAERPMYFNYKGKWTGGHDVVGANAPGDTWYFAEGTTRTGFEEWICLQNPNAYPVEALITYMQDDGLNDLDILDLPATSRQTIWVNNEIYGEHDVSVRVESSDGSPIIVERPMYFTYGVYNWTGGHDVLGY